MRPPRGRSRSRQAVVIDHVAEDAVYRDHHTPRQYGFQSYISMPIILADGTFFGRARLAEFAAREAASGLPTPEVMRRLQRAILSHQTGALQDDATTLFVEWVPLEPGGLTP